MRAHAEFRTFHHDTSSDSGVGEFDEHDGLADTVSTRLTQANTPGPGLSLLPVWRFVVVGREIPIRVGDIEVLVETTPLAGSEPTSRVDAVADRAGEAFVRAQNGTAAHTGQHRDQPGHHGGHRHRASGHTPLSAVATTVAKPGTSPPSITAGTSCWSSTATPDRARSTPIPTAATAKPAPAMPCDWEPTASGSRSRTYDGRASRAVGIGSLEACVRIRHGDTRSSSRQAAAGA